MAQRVTFFLQENGLPSEIFARELIPLLSADELFILANVDKSLRFHAYMGLIRRLKHEKTPERVERLIACLFAHSELLDHLPNAGMIVRHLNEARQVRGLDTHFHAAALVLALAQPMDPVDRVVLEQELSMQLAVLDKRDSLLANAIAVVHARKQKDKQREEECHQFHVENMNARVEGIHSSSAWFLMIAFWDVYHAQHWQALMVKIAVLKPAADFQFQQDEFLLLQQIVLFAPEEMMPHLSAALAPHVAMLAKLSDISRHAFGGQFRNSAATMLSLILHRMKKENLTALLRNTTLVRDGDTRGLWLKVIENLLVLRMNTPGVCTVVHNIDTGFFTDASQNPHDSIDGLPLLSLLKKAVRGLPKPSVK